MSPLAKLLAGAAFVLGITLIVGCAYLFPAMGARARITADPSCIPPTPSRFQGACSSDRAIVMDMYVRQISRSAFDLHLMYDRGGVLDDVVLPVPKELATRLEPGQPIQLVLFQGRTVWVSAGSLWIPTEAHPQRRVFRVEVALAIATGVELVAFLTALILLLTRKR